MWNSWVDVDLIDQIKQLKNVLIDWFYIKKITKKSDRDRMENEELITSLAYIEYHSKSKQKVVDIYQKDNINIEGIITSKLISRVSSKLKINALMLEACTDITVKKEFLNSIKKVKSVIRNLKLILIDRNKEPGETTELFLNNEIEKFVKVSNTRKLQNFYFLWILINKTNFNLVKIKRKDMKKDLLRIFKIINAKHTGFHKNNINNRSLINLFNSHSDVFLNNYTSKAMRKRKLSKKEKEEMIKRQGYKSSISGVPIFDMDDLEVDHTIPLAVQGQDEIDNMGLAHGKENREKGSNFDLN